jgi:pimeloyl-ACP methyl ester carboxylesterase
MTRSVTTEAVRIAMGPIAVDGDLHLPERPAGLVVFAHGSGSSRFSRRNRAVGEVLQQAGFATVLLDLLTRGEEATDERTGEYRFDIPLLGRRVVGTIDWLETRPDLRRLPLALFGASTGAAAALMAAAERPLRTHAVISRGGRPDLAGDALPRVEAPTLLIVGSHDVPVIRMNRDAMRHMRAPVSLEIVAGATHLFEEPGTLEQVAQLAADWCRRHLHSSVQDARSRGYPGRASE